MPGENILIVDDEPLVCKGLERMLHRAHYHVHSVLSGAEALAMAAQKDYALALIDKNMPGMDGLQTCRELKKLCPGLIAILMTGGHAISEAEFLAAGGKTFLHKPFRQGEVLEVVQKALDEKK